MSVNEKILWGTCSWPAPLSTAASSSVPVTLATDSKASSNADSQWWSRPKFVPDPQQAESCVALTKDGAVPEP